MPANPIKKVPKRHCAAAGIRYITRLMSPLVGVKRVMPVATGIQSGLLTGQIRHQLKY